MSSYLVLDTKSLAYRALYSTPDLRNGDDPTGVLYGVLRDLKSFAREFQADHVVACFDSRQSNREKLDPGYKESRRKNRKKKTPEELRALDGMEKQVRALRKDILPRLGVQCLREVGYEADDLMARVCHAVRKAVADLSTATLVSADKDLYQLLCDRVTVYHPSKGKTPGRTVTERSFRTEYGIDPWKWQVAKAIAGCSTDDVPGVAGVGDKTACLVIAGKDHRMKKAITDFCDTPRYALNLRLVQLPLAGCPFVELESQPMAKGRGWDAVLSEYGIVSL